MPSPCSRLFPYTTLFRSLEARQVVPVRKREDDAVGDLEALLLPHRVHRVDEVVDAALRLELGVETDVERDRERVALGQRPDRKSTRLNSSHLVISYAVFC